MNVVDKSCVKSTIRTMSIYRKYPNPVVEADKVFVTKVETLVPYNKDMDKILFANLAKMHDTLRVHYKMADDIECETSFNFHTNIFRCARELFYFQIKNQHNLVQKDKLVGMMMAAYFLATKNILEYDYSEFVPCLADLVHFGGGRCSAKQLVQMEFKLFANTNYCTDTKVYNRVFALKY